MKTEIEIFTLAEKEPEPDERVMVRCNTWSEWYPQVFNKEYKCWDTEDGDDYDFDLDETDRWFRLPE